MKWGLIIVLAAGCASGSGSGVDGGGDDDDVAGATLTVQLAGAGGGTVTSSTGGIDCEPSCSAAVSPGTSVTLTATADADSSFVGWSGGGCAGTGPCLVQVDADTTVTANFGVGEALLTVVTQGPGAVTSNPAGIDCGATCAASFAQGTPVTLTATPTGGGSFVAWSGACTGSGACTVTMNSAQSVTAQFSCGTGTTTFNYTGGAQSFTVPGCVTALTIDAYGAQGGSSGTAGGLGGRATGIATVTGGEVVTIMVGGAGINVGSTGSAAGFAGGFNGGGGVHEWLTWSGQSEGICGTGGGASDVRRGGTSIANRIIVAGGGAGAAATAGGAGGGDVGGTATSSGTNSQGGGGGTQAAGGTAGNCCTGYPNQPGQLGIGGDAYRDGAGSGGGGGGWYGGGGGQFAGGGGGSSYIGGLASATTATGVRAGNGQIIVSW